MIDKDTYYLNFARGKEREYKVAVLFLQYDTEKYPNALTYFEKYIQPIQDCITKFIVINNKGEYDVIIGRDNKQSYIEIGGDNTCWEFSGWQKGVEYLRENKIEYDAVLFANDSFLAPAGSTFDLGKILSKEAIKTAIWNNSIVGHLAGQDVDSVLLNKVVSKYVRTHCFMIPKAILDNIKTVVSVKPSIFDSIFTKNLEYPYFKHDALISHDLKHYWLEHLTKYWHSRKCLINPDGSLNQYMFKMKTLAFFNELLLTARIKQLANKKLPNILEDMQ